MKKISYTAKVRLVTSAILLVIVGFFGVIGYHSTHQLFALTPAPAGVYLYTNKDNYAVGQDVTVTIANNSPGDIYITNNCPQQPLQVYYLNKGSWQHVTASTNTTKCNGEPSSYRIPAHSSTNVDYSYWPQLFNKPGTYQIVAGIVSHSNGPSTTFSVTE